MINVDKSSLQNAVFSTILVFTFLFVAEAGTANAIVCTVDVLSDSGIGVDGRGDLRYCIQAANLSPDPDIVIISAQGTIPLQTSLPVITGNVSITGSGTDTTIIDGQNRSGVSIFNVNAGVGVVVQIRNLTVTRANANNPDGGGIGLRGGALLGLTNVTVDNNTTLAESGGGIFSSGSGLVITNCRITNNHMSAVGSSGAGIFAQGGSVSIVGSVISGNSLANPTDIGGAGIELFQVSSARIENSTISGNLNGNYGAGIDNRSSTLRMSNVTISNNFGGVQAAGLSNISGNVILRNCTIAGNVATRFGGGIYNVGISSMLTIANSIVAYNIAPEGGNDIFNFAFITGLGANIIESPISNSGTITGSGTISIADPKLLRLRNYGGLVPTSALGLNSPARNSGVNAEALDTQGNTLPLTVDARGTGYPRINSGTVDIGAFESPSDGASVLLSGRVTGGSNGLKGRTTIVLTYLATGERRYAIANPFGYYNLAGISYGSDVRIEIVSKSAIFQSQTLSVVGERRDLNFTAEP